MNDTTNSQQFSIDLDIQDFLVERQVQGVTKHLKFVTEDLQIAQAKYGVVDNLGIVGKDESKPTSQPVAEKAKENRQAKKQRSTVMATVKPQVRLEYSIAIAEGKRLARINH